MPTYLITGGCGFIGSNFIRHFLVVRPDIRIINLDKLTYAGNPDNLRDLTGDPRYTFIQGDIADRSKVAECFELAASATAAGGKPAVTGIINFAAETHVDRSISGDTGSFITTDVYGSYILLEAARDHGVELFFQISTDEVYGSIETGSFIETDPLEPNSPYSASKAGAEMLVRSFGVTWGVPYIITRCSNNFGPYQYPEKLIPLFITNALDELPLPLYGDGLNVRDWIYVQDHCEAVVFLLENGTPGEIYNIGGGNERTNVDITRMILDALGLDHSLITPVKDRPGHDRRYSLSCEKMAAMGWRARFPFSTAMSETIAWYRNNERWWRPLKNRREEFLDFYRKHYGVKITPRESR
ncbi:dTDP-glucose 4,6-dehydratase [bacterium]|nr:dTDP-glucose 4,6-dehydratase [candidate division CSSED10-310 bacterium]